MNKIRDKICKITIEEGKFNVLENGDYVYYYLNDRKFKNLSFSLAYELYKKNPKERKIYWFYDNEWLQLTSEDISVFIDGYNKILEEMFGVSSSESIKIKNDI